MDAQDSPPQPQASLLDVVDAAVAKLLDLPGEAHAFKNLEFVSRADDQAANFRLLDEPAGLWSQPQFSYAQLRQLAAGLDQMSAHAETLSRVAEAVTEAGPGWISVGDDITDGDDAAAMVVADGSGSYLLVCIPVPASMTVQDQTRQVRVQVDTEIAVNLAAAG